ncbi:hypothetical protein COLO4_12508 [Corchorus olitorius]|uniref:Uncharacterized protein n=1 Tax=Corchorus olitorius TaxID=93759 RepID=A0A1R3K0S4_9ROSI|nr:hypothetical protein COLO4_12508 [Corchorus olitorius]
MGQGRPRVLGLEPPALLKAKPKFQDSRLKSE